MMDKDLYRHAIELHRAWNEFDEIERVRKAGTLTPAEAWRQYVDLKVAVPNQNFAAVRAALRQAFSRETRQGAPPNPLRRSITPTSLSTICICLRG